CLLSYSSVF
nr:immunoglobulin light chain junction region [Homo sapiens]MCD68615.1 immunoglobulin light chain junction region [Homo sapiens]